MVRSEEINMENQEDILDALSTYEKKPTPEIPPLLESFLRQVAKTGETLFPWQRLKSLMINKLDQVITQFHQDFPADHLQTCPNVENTKFEEMRKRILQSVEEFQGAPFTIQRICELMTEPKKHYKRSDKFLRGIEKNVLVVSTVDPFGRKIVSESRNLVNGLDMNGYSNEQLDQRPLQFTTFPSPHQTPAAECVRLNEFLDSNANNSSTNGTLDTNHDNENRFTFNRNEVSESNVSNQSEVKVSSPCEGEVVAQSDVKVSEEAELKGDGSKPKSTDNLSTSEHRTEGDISSSESTPPPQEETREQVSPEVDKSPAEDTTNEKDTVEKEDRLSQIEDIAPAEALPEQSKSVTGDPSKETQESITDPSAVSSSSELADNLNPNPSDKQQLSEPDKQQLSEPVHSSTENQDSSSSSSEASSVEEASSSVQSSESNASSVPESTLPNEPCEETSSSDNVFKSTDPCVGEKMEVDSTVSNVQPIDTAHQVDDNCHNSESESTGDKVKVESESNTQSADVPMDED